jgi:hypothetical protein
MITPHSSRSILVRILIALQFLLGLGALAGGACLMISPDGSLMHMPMSFLSHSPFVSFFLPGLLLFTFVGLYPLAVAYSLWRKPAWQWPNAINPFKQFHWSWAASLAAGVIVLIWISVEVQFTGIGVLHYVYWGWGALILLFTLVPNVRSYCKL